MKIFEQRLKHLKSSEMFAYREIEKFDFTFAQVWSNDCAFSQHSAYPFIENVHRMLGWLYTLVRDTLYSYNDHIIILNWHTNRTVHNGASTFTGHKLLTRLDICIEILYAIFFYYEIKSIISRLSWKSSLSSRCFKSHLLNL